MKLTTLLLNTAITSALAISLPACAQKDTMHNTPMAGEEHSSSQPSDNASMNMRDDEKLAKTTPAASGNVKYVSGGISDSGMRAIDMEESHYNLKMLFVSEGEYLAEVNVKIMNSKGHTLLATTTKGPLLLVKMPSGTYTVMTKTHSGAALKRHVKVSADHLVSYVLRYPANAQ